MTNSLRSLVALSMAVAALSACSDSADSEAPPTSVTNGSGGGSSTTGSGATTSATSAGGSGGGDATGTGGSAPGVVQVVSGDKELTLKWEANADATGYVVRRIGPTTYEGTQTVATLDASVTSYLDSPANYADPDGRGLVNGETYNYTVSAVVNGGEVLLSEPVAGMPDDGIQVPGWTDQWGSTKRDARNTGWRPTGVTLTVVNGDYTMQDGEVIDSKLITGMLIIPTTVKSGTVRRSWIRCEGAGDVGCVFNGGYVPPANTTPILFEDVEIGQGLLEGLPKSAFRSNGAIGWVHYIARRLYVHGMGTCFTPDAGFVLEDSYITDLFADGPDPHIDIAWVSNGTSGPLTVRRNNMEDYIGGSSNLGPGAIGSGTYVVESNLFNGGSYEITINDHYEVTGNRFKRAPSGYFDQGGQYGPVWSLTSPSVWTDNHWADDDSDVTP